MAHTLENRHVTIQWSQEYTTATAGQPNPAPREYVYVGAEDGMLRVRPVAGQGESETVGEIIHVPLHHVIQINEVRPSRMTIYSYAGQRRTITGE